MQTLLFFINRFLDFYFSKRRILKVFIVGFAISAFNTVPFRLGILLLGK
jgi:hypothetical protein